MSDLDYEAVANMSSHELALMHSQFKLLKTERDIWEREAEELQKIAEHYRKMAATAATPMSVIWKEVDD